MARRRAHSDRGFTLIEVMLVLALIAGAFVLIAGGMRRLNKTDLRDETVKIAAVMRSAYNMATFSGVHHRVVFDLENQTYRIEACPGEQKLYRSEEEPVPDAEAIKALMEKLEERSDPTSDQLPEIIGAETPEQAAEAAAALEGVQLGTVRCEVPKTPNNHADGRGNIRKIENSGVRIKEIHVAHLEDPISEGLVTINFFPLGSAEKAVIVMTDKRDNEMVLLVHRLTGIVEWKRGDYDPDDHMRRNALGDREEDDRETGK